jgi:hypothetical protein
MSGSIKAASLAAGGWFGSQYDQIPGQVQWALRRAAGAMRRRRQDGPARRKGIPVPDPALKRTAERKRGVIHVALTL